MALPIWGLFMQKVYADPSLNYPKRDFDAPKNPLSVDFDCGGDDSPSPSKGTQKKHAIDPDEF
jgi:penicillin-binding protein 1A